MCIGLEQRVRKYLAEMLKKFAERMLDFGQFEAIEESEKSKTAIRGKKEYSFEEHQAFSESESIKIKHLKRKPFERFESYEEYLNKRAFWDSK